MHVAILAFDGFNELDSLVALGILNRIRKTGWKVSLACPEARVTSMNGVDVLDQPLFARGNGATAGGCLASQYLAAWIIARPEGVAPAEHALHYVAPVGEKDLYVKRALDDIGAYLRETVPAAQ